MINRIFSPKKIKDAKEKRSYGLWGNLPLAGKLLLAFSALFMFAVVIAVIALSGANGTKNAYENTLSQGIEMRRLSNQMAINLSKARDDEKNFLLRWRTEGYDTAYKKYVTLHIQDVANIREDIKQLAAFGPVAATVSTGNTSQAGYEADLATLTQNVDTYDKSFHALVDAYHKKGFDETTDFESQFRSAAVNIDSYLFSGGLVGGDSIKVTYLRIRLSEKNYLADAAQPYADDIHSLIPVLKDQIALSTQLEPAAKTDLLAQVDAYLNAFDGLVALDREIAVRNRELLTAAEKVQSLTSRIEGLGAQLATDSISAARSNSAQTNIVSIMMVAVVLILTIIISFTLSRQITRPVTSLRTIAQEISEGNFRVQAEVKSADEIGTLAQTINDMSAQLKNALQNLENHARELEQQTEQLELTSQQSEKRSRQLQTISEIARYISTEKELKKLLPLISQTISDQFGFYHIGIFLLDDTGTYAVLLASNSPGGQKMLQRQHSLKVGQVGIVGNVTATGVPRIASDIGEDATYFNNPDLPLTRSELALPLKVEKQVIGALDIQSTETNAFSDEEVDVLTILADQVSIAIQNSRLFNEIEKALAESNAIQRQFVRETWSRLPKEEKLSGYRYSMAGTVPLEEETEHLDFGENKQEVSVPIILRGETIGTLSVQVPKGEEVGVDQMELIKAVAERVALSAENARLFEDTTRRAERERIVSDIATKIGASVRTETILRTTAKELSHFLDDADIFINLQASRNGKEGAK